MIKIIVLSVASFVLVAVGFFIGLAFSPTTNFSTASPGARDATSDYEANAANTENVYQQIVVGGWGTRDMLEVIANQTGGLDRMAQQLVQAQETQVRLQVVQVLLTGLLITSVLVLVPLSVRSSAEQAVSGKQVKLNKWGKINSLDEDQLTDWFEAGEPSLDSWNGKPGTFENWLTYQKQVRDQV
jgi:hypothetical protein